MLYIYISVSISFEVMRIFPRGTARPVCLEHCGKPGLGVRNLSKYYLQLGQQCRHHHFTKLNLIKQLNINVINQAYRLNIYGNMLT